MSEISYEHKMKARHEFVGKIVNEVVAVGDESEDAAIHLFHRLRDHFGWAGTLFTRQDASTQAGRDLTDEEWDKVRNNYYWRKGIADTACEMGWDGVQMALEDSGVVDEEE